MPCRPKVGLLSATNSEASESPDLARFGLPPAQGLRDDVAVGHAPSRVQTHPSARV